MKTPCVALLVPLLLAPAAGHAFKRTEVGEPLKDFALASASGESVRLSESLGAKATVVVFWATWSPRSAEALGDFQKLYEEHRAGGLQVVAVNVEHQEWDPADAARLEAFVRERGLTFPVVYDRDLGVFNEYGVIAVPSTALAGPDGGIVELLEGYADMTRGEFREAVLRVLGVLETRPAQAPETAGYRPAGMAARYLQMGDILLQREMPSKAERAFRQALEEDPRWPRAHRRLAVALEAQGKTEEAGAARARAAELGGEQPAAEPAPEKPGPGGPDPRAERLFRMGSLLLQRGSAAAAEAALRQAVERAPGYSAAYEKLAEALEAQGKGAEAAATRAEAARLGGKP